MELNLLNLLLILLAAWLAGNLAIRYGYPAVLGELLAGIVLGPPLLNLLHGGPDVAVLAEVGVLLMMLYIGMEIDPRDLKKVSVAGGLAALGGFITPFVLAYLTVIWFGGTSLAGLFVGIAAGITSLVTKSRILVDLQLLDTRIAHVMMAGALISDTLSLIIFAAILGVAEGGVLDWGEIAIVALRAAAFFGLTALIGLKLFPYGGRRLSATRLNNRTFHFTLVLLIAVLFGELAELAGLHSILGAFIAGLFIQENVLGRTLSQDLTKAVREASIGFLAPIFFVTAGFEVSFSVFGSDLGLFLSILLVATLGKIIGTAVFYLPTGYGWREGLVIGAGMNGRGAVEIIVAGIALSMGLISREIFSILVFMAIFTTSAVPLFLKWGTDWLHRRGELVRTAAERRGTLIIGAGALARRLAKELVPGGPVWLLDTNQERCTVAREEGLHAVCGNALEEAVLSEAHAAEAASVVVMTANPEVNILAAKLAKEVFFVPEVHVLSLGRDDKSHDAPIRSVGATTLFGGSVDLGAWDYWVSRGEVAQWKNRVTDLEVRTPQALLDRVGSEPCLPLAIHRKENVLPFHDRSTFKAEDEIEVLCFSQQEDTTEKIQDRFDDLVARAPILDLDEPLSIETFFQRAADRLAVETGLTSEQIRDTVLRREVISSSVIAPGLAVPHAVVNVDEMHLLIARSRPGLQSENDREPIHAIFLLLRPAAERNQHLRVLAAIAQVVQDAAFETNWLEASSPAELRSLLLRSQRRRYPDPRPRIAGTLH